MKNSVRSLTIAGVFLLALGAHAESQVLTDRGAARLEKILGGKTLVCGVVEEKDRDSEEAGFFPVRLRAKHVKDGTRVEIFPDKAKHGFGMGGDEIDPIEITPNWAIVSVGDDGRRHLFFDHSMLSACDPAAPGTGDMPGIITEIWDAGTSASRTVQCCLE